MEFQTKQFKKTVSVVGGFTRFFYGLSIIGLVISTVALITMQFLPKDIFLVDNNLNLELGKFITYNLSIDSPITIKPFITSILISVIIATILLTVIIRQLYRVLDNVKKDKIFAIENGKKIAIIGYLIIISSLIGQVTQFYVSYTIMSMINDPNINAESSFNFELIFVGVLVVILARIFTYGTYLQQEYDSTI